MRHIPNRTLDICCRILVTFAIMDWHAFLSGVYESRKFGAGKVGHERHYFYVCTETVWRFELKECRPKMCATSGTALFANLVFFKTRSLFWLFSYLWNSCVRITLILVQL